jgi:periplasmic divalent cation tolerance protein
MALASDAPLVVLSTAPDAACAGRLAQGLVERRLAACVQLLPGVESVYSWKGKIERSQEVLLLIKTRADRWPAVQEFFAEQHPYEVPECLALEAAQVEPRYLAWLRAEGSG